MRCESTFYKEKLKKQRHSKENRNKLDKRTKLAANEFGHLKEGDFICDYTVI